MIRIVPRRLFCTWHLILRRIEPHLAVHLLTRKSLTLCLQVTTALEMSIEKLKDEQDKNKFRRSANHHEESPDSSDEESDGE